MPTPEERIADAFNAHFANFDISVTPEEVVVGARRRIGERGWLITYRVDADDAGFPSLELYATHRMTNDTHLRIWADGHLEHLDAIEELYAYDPKVPGSEDAARTRYFEHNRSVERRLRERGLYPEGDINAFLRTGGGEPASETDEAAVEGQKDRP
jgi:hypothetical protein